jgi:hypothetical protein
VHRSALFHFVLDAEVTAGAAVVMTVYDADGRAVAELRSTGEAVTRDVALRLGRYTVVFTLVGPAGSRASYRLRGSRLDDPIGPMASDPDTPLAAYWISDWADSQYDYNYYAGQWSDEPTGEPIW